MNTTQDYLEAARNHLEDDTATGRTPVDEIKSIFVASDDENAVNEVRALVSEFFPNVEPENITWISGEGTDGTVQTRSKLEVRKSPTVCSTTYLWYTVIPLICSKPRVWGVGRTSMKLEPR